MHDICCEVVEMKINYFFVIILHASVDTARQQVSEIRIEKQFNLMRAEM
jgi:hypothetical protein